MGAELRCEGISKSYGSVNVLNDISISVSPSQIIGIAGANGSGKSTLLSITATVLSPSSGAVLINGKDAFKTPDEVKKHLGFVPQETALFERLSVYDNIKLFCALYSVNVTNVPFDKAFLKKKVSALSGGMKKKVSLFVAQINEPSIIIMDEPTSALDVSSRFSVTEDIKRLKASGKSVIFTSHYADELALCDVVYILKNGTVAYKASPSELSDGASFDGHVLIKLIGEE